MGSSASLCSLAPAANSSGSIGKLLTSTKVRRESAACTHVLQTCRNQSICDDTQTSLRSDALSCTPNRQTADPGLHYPREDRAGQRAF